MLLQIAKLISKKVTITIFFVVAIISLIEAVAHATLMIEIMKNMSS
jgi:hypothetical protein